MEKAKIFLICCHLFFQVGLLFAVYLSQGFSKYFTGTQYLKFSILTLIPLFVIGILALIKLAGGKAKVSQAL